MKKNKKQPQRGLGVDDPRLYDASGVPIAGADGFAPERVFVGKDKGVDSSKDEEE